MQRINYTAPALNDLINHATSLSEDYHQKRPQDANPTREEQIKELVVIHRRIQALRSGDGQLSAYTDDTLIKVSLGAWLYVVESIYKECKLINRSELYKLAISALNITPENKLDDESRLIYLAELHNFVSVLQLSAVLDSEIQLSDVNMESLIEAAMSSVLNRMMTSIQKLMHAVPTEAKLNEYFSTIYASYKEKRLVNQRFYKPRVHPDRPFCAQLAQAVATLVKSDNLVINQTDLERSHKILLGLLIYMMRTINGGGSELYELCRSMMNGEPNTLSPDVQIDCLVTLDTFLEAEANIKNLIIEGKKQFGAENRLVNLDTKLRTVTMNLEQELTILRPKLTNTATGGKMLGAAAAVVAYPLGYGVGEVIGTAAAGAESHANARLKTFLTDWINSNAHILLGVRGNGVGYIATTPIVTAVYQTVAGNLSGALFAVTGGVVAGSVGYLVVDILLRNIYNFVRQPASSSYKDPLYASNVNPELLKCLASLPDSVLSDNKKEKIEQVAGLSNRLG